jgi:hypothetical protein
MPILFGFLPYKHDLKFSAGEVFPVPEFDERLGLIKKCANEDGYLYLPQPPRLFALKPSHELHLRHQPERNIREGPAGFIIHFLAFLFGTRLQFSDWYFDGRVPVTARHRTVLTVATSYKAQRYLDLAFRTWAAWPEPEQRRFISILYVFSRTCAYQWDWEEFMIQYMVLDALWKMGERLFRLRAKNHQDRVRVLCAHFSYNVENWIDVKELVRLRNDLFHETLWHQARPSSTVGKLTENRPYYMHARMVIPNEMLISKFLQIVD